MPVREDPSPKNNSKLDIAGRGHRTSPRVIWKRTWLFKKVKGGTGCWSLQSGVHLAIAFAQIFRRVSTQRVDNLLDDAVGARGWVAHNGAVAAGCGATHDGAVGARGRAAHDSAVAARRGIAHDGAVRSWSWALHFD
jgi:hypothetical protein